MSAKSLQDKRSVSRNSIIRRKSGRSSLKSVSILSAKDEAELICHGVMQTVLENALDKIHEHYMEKQIIKFTMHCAHQALMKALRIHFYQHNHYQRTSELWSAEKPAAPSAPDSWGCYQVPLSHNISSEHELTTLNSLEESLARKGANIMYDKDLEVESVVSLTLLNDIKAILNNLINNLCLVETEEKEETISTVSAFTMVVEGTSNYSKHKVVPEYSKISIDGSVFKLPKIDLVDSGHSRKLSSAESLITVVTGEKLPPIRTDADYTCESLSLEEDNKLKKMKKP